MSYIFTMSNAKKRKSEEKEDSKETSADVRDIVLRALIKSSWQRKQDTEERSRISMEFITLLAKADEDLGKSSEDLQQLTEQIRLKRPTVAEAGGQLSLLAEKSVRTLGTYFKQVCHLFKQLHEHESAATDRQEALEKELTTAISEDEKRTREQNPDGKQDQSGSQAAVGHPEPVEGQESQSLRSRSDGTESGPART
jgi:hypothetical protein